MKLEGKFFDGVNIGVGSSCFYGKPFKNSQSWENPVDEIVLQDKGQSPKMRGFPRGGPRIIG